MNDLVEFDGLKKVSNHSVGLALKSMTEYKRKELRTSVRMTIALSRITKGSK